MKPNPIASFRSHLLFDFDADIDIILDLTRVRIRRITKEEKFYSFELNGNTKRGRGLGGGNEGRLFFVADCASYGNPKYTLDKLATLLLLFKRGTEGGNLPTFSTEFGGKGTLESAHLPPINKVEIDPGHSKYPSYFLRADELTPFATFWSSSTTKDWHPNLVTASRRLIRMQSRTGTDSSEDRLIDSMIAFEALLLKREDDKGPMIAHRSAELLGDSTGQVKRRLKLAYECRNDLVHDGQISNGKFKRIAIRFEIFASQIEGDLRSSMFRYIELMNNGCSKKDILRQLGFPLAKRLTKRKRG